MNLKKQSSTAVLLILLDLQTNDHNNYDVETPDDVNVSITGKALVDALEILMNERDSFLNDLAALYDLEKVGK